MKKEAENGAIKTPQAVVFRFLFNATEARNGTINEVKEYSALAPRRNEREL